MSEIISHVTPTVEMTRAEFRTMMTHADEQGLTFDEALEEAQAARVV